MPKISKRLIRIRLPEDLVQAVEEMGLDSTIDEIPFPRTLHNMIEVSLMWAVWSHSRGRGPDAEIGRLAQGYIECDAVVKVRRKRREVEELEALYKLGDFQTVPGQQKQKRRD